MKKILLVLLAFCIALPSFGQKLSKEEREAAAKAANTAALDAVKAKAFVLVPTTYTEDAADGTISDNTDNSNFFSCEGENCFAQGVICCDNRYTNICEPTEYSMNIDKKGNMKLRIVVSGRMLKGTYTFSMRHNTNHADVIFSPQNGTTRKFSGPIVPLKEANYNKRSNPM